jgi:hypothetical protein
MFEQIGRVIDDLLYDFRVMLYGTWLYRRPYATCWIGIYYWLRPEQFTKDSVEVFYRCGYLTDKQYKRYWDKLEKKWGE